MDKSFAGILRILSRVALVAAIVIVYAYGLQVTKVDLEKPQEVRRQEQLTNILRGLAQPDLITYEIERLEIETSILIPCKGEAPEPLQPEPGQPELTLSTYCARPGEEITVYGSGFNPAAEVFLFFVPYVKDQDDQVELKLTRDVIRVGSEGTFELDVELKDDRVSPEPQLIRAVVNQRSGAPRASEALLETRNKIIETVFLAFIATTLGVILAIPMSFLAARNLMFQVTSTFSKFMASLIAMPVGAYFGFLAFSYLTQWGQSLTGLNVESGSETAFWAMFPLIGLAAMQNIMSGGQGHWKDTLKRVAIIIVSAAFLVIGLAALSQIGRAEGLILKTESGLTALFGNFILIFSDLILLGMPAVGALIGLLTLNPLSSQLVENTMTHFTTGVAKIVSLVLAIGAGATLFSVVAIILNWFYQFGPVLEVIAVPAVVGAIIFGIMGVIINPLYTLPTGMFVYYFFRTIMNIFRSIEPLVMVVAFAVWVGIGPFAGVMALGLHTIVALGKLYSEQVENIAAGPIEAITATGANRLQTIVYAVIPQIVPPYIAFTLYRWDINVRMSTIIGFGGGGGIGFLLSQNINLLKYRQASVNMIAIAVVVASLDYLSAKVREKIT